MKQAESLEEARENKAFENALK
ncbi:hypothetical protein LCGC14_1143580, partial [marine sediment metagenome]